MQHPRVPELPRDLLVSACVSFDDYLIICLRENVSSAVVMEVFNGRNWFTAQGPPLRRSSKMSSTVNGDY